MCLAVSSRARVATAASAVRRARERGSAGWPTLTILQRANEIRAKVQQGQPWEEALAGIKGIGPWTLSVFRIMVLRDPDVLPLGDVGLKHAIANIYGKGSSAEQLRENWRPFRSVACWYLWRTLGNEQLG